MSSSKVPTIANVVPKNWKTVLRFNRDVQKYLNSLSKSDQVGLFTTLTLSGLTASRLVATDSSKTLESTNLNSWVTGTANEINITDDGDGTITIGIVDPLIVSKGGTGMNSLTDHSLLVGSGTDPITALGVATDGQLPIGSTGADPVLATLTGTANQISVTNGAGSITLALTGNMDEIAALTPTDGNFIVGNGSTWITESGDTARTSLGVGTGDSPTLTGLTLSGLTQGSVIFAGASGVISEDNTNFFWDDTNNRLGILTNSPDYPLECAGGIYSTHADGIAALDGQYGALATEYYSSTSAESANVFQSKRARGTLASPSDMQDGDWILKWRLYQYYSSTFAQVCGIYVDVPDVSEGNGRFNFYEYTAAANVLLSFSKDDIKFGDADGSHYVRVDPTSGHMTFNGNATVWNDTNVGGLTLGGPAANLPDEVAFTDENGADTGIYTYGFDVGEQVAGAMEIPHSYKEGSDITFHVHWQGNDAPTGTDKVKWELTYTVAQEGATLDATTTITVETDIDTQYEEYTSSFAAITGTNFNIGDQFLFTLERVAASANEYGGDALIMTAGLHCEEDSVGSNQITTK